MASSTRDLWPDDLADTSVVAPVAILREQAALLAKKTKGLIEGRIQTNTAGTGRNFLHHFFLVAPPLDNYTYHLLTVSHEMTLYPVTVMYVPTRENESVESEDAFVALLATSFRRPETRRVIEALLVQMVE